MTPLERADTVRDGIVRFETMNGTLRDLLPPGSLILTPDEAETVRADFRAALAMGEHGLPARALALLAGKGQT